MDLIIKGAKVVDPTLGLDEVADIAVKDGKIAGIGKFDRADTVIDAKGLIACPGFVDMHVHLRDPGQTAKEDIRSGYQAALAGGVTSVLAMPNTIPAIDNPETIDYIQNKAKTEADGNVYLCGAMTKNRKGQEVCDYAMFKRLGIVAVSDDGDAVKNPLMMRKVLEQTKEYGLLPISHCDDVDLINGGVVNEGEISKKLGVLGNPSVAESVMISRDLLLAEYLQTNIHIAHVSTKTSVALIREAKKRGVRVTCETAAHYFSFDESAVLEMGSKAKMNPPLRGKEDVLAIIEGLCDGTIDVIATDHAPHKKEEKDMPLNQALNGVVGLETSFAASYTKLVKPGFITVEKLIELMSVNPAKLLNINKGTLRENTPADIVLLDLDAKWQVDPKRFCSKGRYTPFEKETLSGKVCYTVVDGIVRYKEGKVV